jgi:hypothetical protein
VRIDLESVARYQAYRWFRGHYREASHQEAWTYACENWRTFVLLPEPTNGQRKGRNGFLGGLERPPPRRL